MIRYACCEDIDSLRWLMPCGLRRDVGSSSLPGSVSICKHVSHKIENVEHVAGLCCVLANRFHGRTQGELWAWAISANEFSIPTAFTILMY